MPHLFLAVTAHGYGHLAQSAPVAEELAKRVAGLRVTLQGDIDPSFVRNRLPSCSRPIPEAACNGKPVLYVSRRDWPEEPALTAWLKRQVQAREISLSNLIAGRVLDPIGELLGAESVVPVPPTGIAEAADLLEPFL